jgi:hypothetical protein
MDAPPSALAHVAVEVMLRKPTAVNFMPFSLNGGDSALTCLKLVCDAAYNADDRARMLEQVLLFKLPDNVDRDNDDDIDAYSIKSNKLRSDWKASVTDRGAYFVARHFPPGAFVCPSPPRPAPHHGRPVVCACVTASCARVLPPTHDLFGLASVQCARAPCPLPPLTRAPFSVLFACRCWRRR